MISTISGAVGPFTKFAGHPAFMVIVVAIVFLVFAYFILYPVFSAVVKWIFLNFVGG